MSQQTMEAEREPPNFTKNYCTFLWSLKTLTSLDKSTTKAYLYYTAAKIKVNISFGI